MNKYLHKRNFIYKSLVAGACIFASLSVQAKSVNLRIGDSLPAGHYISNGLIEYWMDEVSKELGDNFRFQHFPAEQLGKASDMLSLTQSGVLDISYIGPSYISDKMPLSAVAQLPGMFNTSCEGTLAYWNLIKPGGKLYELEFKQNKVRPLMALALSPYQVFTSKKAIQDIESFKGLKLRVTGGAMEEMANNIGAVPIQMSAPETRDGLSRGTLDGLIFPNSSLLPYDLEVVLKYGTEGVSFGSFVATYSISEKTWQSLSEAEKEVFTRIGEKATLNACEKTDALELSDKVKVENAGVSYVEFNEHEKKLLNEASRLTAEKWAKDLDKRNRPGTEVLESWLESLKGVRTQ
ncbi:TRAP-type mannitol/chloroaromatic compound transport system, periplasmic component [Oligella urethralis]|uniref:TRAP transporter substrate-binding protein n=1 Tax=Oligella urethralis TaxID=90245 RepID=UPI000CFEB606|nr:TRAP transporter substrate-binding protein DctP [Oligella urethralis]AVL71956.1 C4-dicarboxylate ABC transporter [Oligella urethralis]SUA52125.1 TRAP-type mannitol/chloroaromatic compound transport system, periplasmic component [Oligella urethralis]